MNRGRATAMAMALLIAVVVALSACHGEPHAYGGYDDGWDGWPRWHYGGWRHGFVSHANWHRGWGHGFAGHGGNGGPGGGHR
jgi:hypothetical protein